MKKYTLCGRERNFVEICHKISIRSNPFGIRAKVSSSSNRVKIERHREPCIRSRLLCRRVAWKHGNDTCKISKRARRYFFVEAGDENSPKQLPTFPWIQRDRPRLSRPLYWIRLEENRWMSGGGWYAFSTVACSKTRQIVARASAALDRSLKIHGKRKKERSSHVDRNKMEAVGLI